MVRNIFFAVLIITILGSCEAMKQRTKQASPEAIATYVDPNRSDTIQVNYSSPSKNDRVIFGELVPYGEVWRTGANEATLFTTNTAIAIGGKQLPAGQYTLWTIPEEDEWTVIFNEKMYSWGVNFRGKATRNAEADVLQLKVPVKKLDQSLEKFTISFTKEAKLLMNLAWDQTQVSVPMAVN